MKEEFGTLVRELRKKRGLSLRKFAAELDIDFRDLSRVERDELLPSSSMRAKLTTSLDIRYHQVENSQPPFSEEALLPFKERIRFKPKADRPTSVRFRAALAQYPRMKELAIQLPAWGRSYMRRTVCDSAPEAYATTSFLVARALPVLTVPYKSGFRWHAVVDPATKLLVNQHRFPGLVLGSLLLIPQVSLLAGKQRIYTCDFLVKCEGLWFDLEIDGKGHDTSRDPDRERDLLIPILRLDDKMIDSPHFVPDLKRLFAQQLPQNRAQQPNGKINP